jgi:cytochrome c-type biogenesis protein
MDVHGAASSTIMGGSAAAAFIAGMIAFFAPCCSGVMMPTYLAAIGGGNRFRTARLTAIYVAGVAAVVLPITLGAGAIGQWTSRYHPQLFVIGGLMMIFTAVTLWRGSMLPMPIPQPELTGTAGSVFVLGVFSGAATACCAPVLAGAVALSALNQTWLGGLALGGAYLIGIVTPLVLLALVFNGVKKKVRDPKFTLQIASYRKRISLTRLVGAFIFGASGVFFIGLALAGESQSGNSVQRWISRQLNHHVAAHAGQIPNWLMWPTLALFAVLLVYLVVKPSRPQKEQVS